MSSDPDAIAQQIAELRSRVDSLEQRLPRSNIISTKFWSRAWAVLGHQLALVGIFYGILFGLALLFELVGAIFRGGF